MNESNKWNESNQIVSILKSWLFLHHSTEIICDGNGFQNGALYFQNGATVPNYQTYLKSMQTKEREGYIWCSKFSKWEMKHLKG